MAEPRYTTPITAQFGDRLEHEVTDEDACAARRGEYSALCGAVFVAAPMIAEAGASCPDCAAIIASRRAAAKTAAGQRPRHRRRGLLWRLFRHPGDFAIYTQGVWWSSEECTLIDRANPDQRGSTPTGFSAPNERHPATPTAPIRVVTSSASQPCTVAATLDRLAVQDGHNVLEIGTCP